MALLMPLSWEMPASAEPTGVAPGPTVDVDPAEGGGVATPTENSVATTVGTADAATAGAASDTSTDRYIVQIEGRSVVPEVVEAVEESGGQVTDRFVRRLGMLVVEGDDTTAVALGETPGVEAVWPDEIVTLTGEQVNPPWGLDRIDQPALPRDSRFRWDVDGTGVTAYVVDTGIASAHTDFGSRVTVGFDAFDGGRADEDCNGHGTHVAGTVGGTKYGVAKNVTLVPVRVFGCENSTYTSTIVAGLDWIVADHDAGESAVANLSLGGPVSSALDTAVDRVIADGVPVVVAAGNENADACGVSPARAPRAITVGSTTSTDARSSFSNFGTCVDVWAPGSGIESADAFTTSGSLFYSGTSMAAPHVAGVVARLLDANPDLSVDEVSAVVRGEAVDLVVGRFVQTGSYLSRSVPGAPTGLSVVAVDGDLTFSWSSPPTGTAAHWLEYSDGTTVLLDRSVTSHVRTDVSSDGPLSLQLSGLSSAGRGSTSSVTWGRHGLSVSLTGSGSGSVVSDPAGVDCGSDCVEVFDHGTSVTLTATPAVGSSFTGWSGACSGTGVCTVSMTEARSVTASFALDSHELSVVVAGSGSGSVVSDPAGVDCGSDCVEVFDHGTSVTLTATPAVGSSFTGWTGVVCPGTGTCTVSMIEAKSVTATFTPDTHELAVVVAGTGAGSVVSDPAGVDCGSDCVAVFDHGTEVTLTATPDVGSSFTGWSGACSGSGVCTVSMTEAKSVTATFTPDTHELAVVVAGTGAGSVVSDPAGVDCGSDCVAVFDHGTEVTLTATPEVGSSFTGWTGVVCPGTGTCTVSMTEARSVTATFALNTHELAVVVAGTGAGSVVSDPAGVDCGSDCVAVFDHGSSVTLTAVPAAGSSFTGWSGACSGSGVCTVSMTEATSVTGAFALDTHELAVVVVGSGSGSVVSDPEGIDCDAECTAVFDHGSSVTLTATPDVGSSFVGWSGACSGTGVCTVSMTEAKSVTATFSLNTHELSVVVAGTGAGSVVSDPVGVDCGSDCVAVFDHGTSVTLTATPGVGSSFTGWSDLVCLGTGTCTVSMTEARSVTASFTLNSYELSVVVAGSGSGSVVSDPAGIDCGTDCVEVFDHATEVTLSATPEAGSSFAGWSGACSGSGLCTVSMTEARSVTASFTLNSHELSVVVAGSGSGSVVSDPAGIDCGSDCVEVFDHATEVTLSATPEVGSSFTGWTGVVCPGTGTCTVPVTEAKSVTATFTLNSYELSVVVGGPNPSSRTPASPGSGVVAVDPEGVECSDSCVLEFDHGDEVTLTAAAAPGSIFAGWSGVCEGQSSACVVSMTQARSTTAHFVLQRHALAVVRSGPGSGVVSTESADIACGETCEAEFDHGSVVVLTATAAPGSAFTGWIGSDCVGISDCVVSMTQAASVTATFSTVATAPRALGASPKDGRAVVSWVAPATDGGSPITGYRVQMARESGVWTTIAQAVPVTTTRFVAGGLDNGVSYRFRVAAVNAAGAGPDSSVMRVRPYTVPDAPRGLTARPGSARVRLDWRPPAFDGGDAVIAYRVRRSVDGITWSTASADLPATRRSFTVSNLRPGVVYRFQVVAVNSAGAGARSDTVVARPS